MIIKKTCKTFKSFTIDFISGGLSGFFGKIIICPIDKIKLLLQTQTYLNSNKNYKAVNLTSPKKFPFLTISDKYKQLFIYLNEDIKSKGLIKSLWFGNLTNISKYMADQAINFGIKGVLGKTINNKILVGGLTGTFSSVILYPFDLVKVRLLTDKNNKYKGFFDCINKIYRNDGVKGLFNGLSASMIGNCCYRGLYFGLYDLGDYYFFKQNRIFNKNIYLNKILLKKYVLAQVVSLVSECLTYPLDTIRNIRMLENNEKNKNISMASCIKKIYEENNSIKGFYNGLLINSLRTVGSSFVLFTYQIINNKIKQKIKENY